MRTCTSAIVTCSEVAGENSPACATGSASAPRTQIEKTNCLHVVMVTPPAASCQAVEKLCRCARTSVVHRYTTTEEHSCRMLKKFRLLTRPTLARQDTPYP